MWSEDTAERGLSVVRVTSLHALHKHAELYATLVAKLGGLESMYYSLAWIEAYARLYQSRGVTMCFLLVYRGQSLIGVAPFQTETRGVLWLKLVKLQFWGAVDCYTQNVHQNILCPDESDRGPVLQCLARYLTQDNGLSWDVIEFERINLQTTCLGGFAGYFSDALITPNPCRSYSFHHPATIDTKLKKKARWAIRASEKRLSQDFTRHSIRLIEQLSSADLDCIQSLHSRRQAALKQRGVNRNAFFNDPLELDAMGRLIVHLQQQGKVRCYQLLADDRVIAFVLLFVAKGQASLAVTAFEDDYCSYQPSRVLWYAVFKNEMERLGTKLIDTAYGDTNIKRDFSTRIDALYNIEIWRPGVNYFTTYKTKTLKGIRDTKAQLASWSMVKAEWWNRFGFCGCLVSFC